MKLIIDDFGLDSENDLAILNLLNVNHQFYGVSCVMNLNNAESMKVLKSIAESKNIQIGLHLCLTNFKATSQENTILPTFFQLLRFSVLKSDKLFWEFVKVEIQSQVDKFIFHFGRFPDFIDGHMHIQQLPKINTILINLLKKQKLSDTFFVRNSSLKFSNILKFAKEDPSSVVKMTFLSLMGYLFKYKLSKNLIPTNAYLFGAYSYKSYCNFSKLVQLSKILATSEDLLFCHPGLVTENLKKIEINQPNRTLEMDYFLKNVEN